MDIVILIIKNYSSSCQFRRILLPSKIEKQRKNLFTIVIAL